MLAVLVAWGFRQPLRDGLVRRATWANPAPAASVVEEVIARASSPSQAIVEAWNAGGMVHREVAIRQVGRMLPLDRPLPEAIQALLKAGAMDPDFNVRESAFASLLAWRHPALVSLATAQLRDADPEIRRLGLGVLRRAEAQESARAVVELFGDPEPEVAALAVTTMGRWAGQDFGVKLSDAVPVRDEATGRTEPRADGIERLRAGVEGARSWWQSNSSRFPPWPKDPGMPPAVETAGEVLAGDFELADLDGVRVRLADLRGKVVLLNFWTTWCTACQGELPTLVELRRRHGSELAILGISLDAVSDEHGHSDGHDEFEADQEPGREVERAGDGVAAEAEVRRKVGRVARHRGINYPVLLDFQNEVGGRFNGGELPTTVLVDSKGRVRRRFVGPRPLAVLEQMIREVSGSGLESVAISR